MITLGNV